MQAFLVRVGIDSSRAYGGWNAPVHPPSREYVYVPIPQDMRRRARPGMERMYAEVGEPLAAFRRAHPAARGASLPPRLAPLEMHLDPDFDHLTYGDGSSSRGQQIATVQPGDWLVFYGAFQSTLAQRPLCYALFGRYVVSECLPAVEVSPDRAHENQHTRPAEPLVGDVVVRAKPGVSGRFRRCIPLDAVPRERLYRLSPAALDAWGGVAVRDGAIQRGSPFQLRDPARFAAWLDAQSPSLVASNWD